MPDHFVNNILLQCLICNWMCRKLTSSLQQLTTEEERGLFDFGPRHGETSPIVSAHMMLHQQQQHR